MNLTYLLLKMSDLCKLDSSSLGDKAANTRCFRPVLSIKLYHGSVVSLRIKLWNLQVFLHLP